jgi:predicted nucleotidyltransferase component of viral defense system
MITDSEIEEKATEFSILPNHVEKDYVHSWILKAISSRPELKRLLVLKGGNALRKCYFPDTRFSKDLDFSTKEHISKDFLEIELREVCTIVELQTGVKFLDRTIIKDKELLIEQIDALEARIYFKGFYNEEQLILKTQFDITQFDKIYLPIQERPILHPYSDANDCKGTINCQKAEEILASKLTTLLHRRKASDLFDLLYSVLIKGENNVNKRELIITFLKKSIFEPRPEDARRELLAVSLIDYKESWTSLLVPAISFLTFEFVIENFSRLINSLFDLIIVSTVFTPGIASQIRRSIGTQIVNFSYFPGNIRRTILTAGRANKMIKMIYNGFIRFVEPYKLEYYVRKRDGIGNEYFWGWDTTGGSSGKIGIKRFFCDKIQSAILTDQSYTPRFPVEI